MSEKKRKRHDSKAQDGARKKIALDGPAQNVKVSVIEDEEQWAPVLGKCEYYHQTTWPDAEPCSLYTGLGTPLCFGVETIHKR